MSSSSFFSCGLFLRIIQPISPACADGAACGWSSIFVKTCFQNLARVLVHDGRRHQPGVDHLEDVLGLEVVRRDPDLHGRLPGLLQLGVELLDALVIGGALRR